MPAILHLAPAKYRTQRDLLNDFFVEHRIDFITIDSGMKLSIKFFLCNFSFTKTVIRLDGFFCVDQCLRPSSIPCPMGNLIMCETHHRRPKRALNCNNY